jgi:hypothetical protein
VDNFAFTGQFNSIVLAAHNLVAGYQPFAGTNWLFLLWFQISINLHNTRESSVNKYDFFVWIVLKS